MNAKDSTRIFAGAMSGTSADGVDVALVEIRGIGLAMTAKLLHHQGCAYDPPLRRAIAAARSQAAIALADLAKLARDISLAYANAVNSALVQAKLHSSDVTAIAAHGQTLFHQPPCTIQWLDPALLAARTACCVVSDFRRADCAAGGQGAPLVPLADFLLFRNPKRIRVLLNLGGIANVTILPAACTLEQVVAFDTGPANCVTDHLMHEATSGAEPFDRGGMRALRGKVDAAMVDRLMRDSYFTRPPPKSTDGPDMLRLWKQTLGITGPSNLEDQLATACAWSAAAVAQAVDNQKLEWIASGGGTQNQALLRELRQRFGPQATQLDDSVLGIPWAAKEAVAFALLAAATLDGQPGNVPSATGAQSRVVLGSITPKPLQP